MLFFYVLCSFLFSYIFFDCPVSCYFLVCFALISEFILYCYLFFCSSMFVCYVRVVVCLFYFFFFKQKTAYEMRISDWSSDVCSSDLMAKAGEIVRLGRGLYQVVDADFGGDHALAEVAKTVPKGIICLLSALAFHELTDQIPARIWIAIGLRSEERRVGKECVSTCRSRWSPYT